MQLQITRTASKASGQEIKQSAKAPQDHFRLHHTLRAANYFTVSLHPTQRRTGTCSPPTERCAIC